MVELIPTRFLTADMLLNHCKIITRELWNRIPEKLKTEKVLEHLLLYNSELLSSIPKSTITNGMVKSALACTGTLLVAMEAKYLNEANVLEALSSNQPPRIGFNLIEVLEKANLFTSLVIDKFISLKKEDLFLIPSKYWTRQAVLKVALAYPSVAKGIPEEMWESGFANELVGTNGICIKYVPESLITRDTWLQSVTSKVDSVYKWKAVPEIYLDYEFYRSAVEKNGSDIFRVPENFLTSELVQIAVKTSGIAFNKLEQVWNNPEFAKKISVGSKQWNWKQAFADAVKTSPDLYKRVPEEFITPELSLIAYQKHRYSISFIKSEHIDQEMVFDLVRNDKSFRHFLPSQWLTDDIYNLAFEVWGIDAIKKAPENIKGLYEDIPYKGYDLDALERVLQENFGESSDRDLEGFAL